MQVQKAKDVFQRAMVQRRKDRLRAGMRKDRAIAS